MKRIKRVLFLLIVLMIPYILNAKTLAEAESYANDYVNFFKDYKKYIITNTKYELVKDNLIANSRFTNGGFISASEFILSQKNGNYTSSYLYDGSSYWTLTENPADTNHISNTFIDQDGITNNVNNTNSGIRVTEYIQNTPVNILF